MRQKILKDDFNQDDLRKPASCILCFTATHYILGICVVFFSTQVTFARLFENSYVSFELPDRWTCQVEETEWICQGQKFSRREAIIVLTAKEVGVSDSLDQYLAYLRPPKQIVGLDGKPLQSIVKIIRKRTLANHEWVDGQHLHSEVPYFYTRYLATTKKNIAILVTFSAHKEVFSKYAPDFLKAINSLRVIAPDRLLDDPRGRSLGGAGEVIGGSQSAFPLDMYSEGELPDEPTAKQRRMKKLLMLLLSSIGIIGAYLFFTREKN